MNSSNRYSKDNKLFGSSSQDQKYNTMFSMPFGVGSTSGTSSASRVGGASGGASSAGVNRSSQHFGNSVSSQSRFSSKNTKLSPEQQQELFQLLSTVENLNVTSKMIETFSNQLVTADILLHNINYSGLSKIRLTVGETSLIWTAIVLYRINSGDGLPPQF